MKTQNICFCIVCLLCFNGCQNQTSKKESIPTPVSTNMVNTDNDRIANNYILKEETLPNEIMPNENEFLQLLHVQEQIAYFTIEDNAISYGGVSKTLRLYQYNLQTKQVVLIKTFDTPCHVWDVAYDQNAFYMTIEKQNQHILYRDGEAIAQYENCVQRYQNLEVINGVLCMFTIPYETYPSTKGLVQVHKIEGDRVSIVMQDQIHTTDTENATILGGNSFAFSSKEGAAYILQDEKQQIHLKHYDGKNVTDTILDVRVHTPIPLQSTTLLCFDTTQYNEVPQYYTLQHGEIKNINTFTDTLLCFSPVGNDQFYYHNEEGMNIAALQEGAIETKTIQGLDDYFIFFNIDTFHDVAFRNDMHQPPSLYHVYWKEE